MKHIRHIFIVYISVVGSLYGQGLDRKVSVTFSDMPIRSILLELGAQYDLKFSYSKDLVQLDKKVTIVEKDASLGEALEKIFEKANVEFLLAGDQIVIRGKNGTGTSRVLKGKVVDKKTNDPLPFASVRLEGTALGTATNLEGDFVLNIPDHCSEGNVIVSFVGYRNQRLPLRNSTAQSIFALEENPTELQAVVVTATTGLSILEEAIARIRENYDTGSVVYTYFIRDRALLDDVPVEASETIYRAYRGSSGATSVNQVKAIRGRRIKDFEAVQRILQTFIRWTGFEIGIGSNVIFSADLQAEPVNDAFPSARFMQRHDFELLGTSMLDGKDVYVISFDQKDAYKNRSLYKGKFFIDTESLAFSRIEMELSPKGIKHARFFGTSRAMALLFGYSKCTILGIKTVTDYHKWNGKWYPASMELLWNTSLVKPKSGFAADLHLKGHVVVTEIQTNSIKPFNSSEVLTAKDRRNWEYHYRTSFWDGHNAVSPDQEMENAFQSIAQKNREQGIDMDFWRRYQPYKSDRLLLVRDSLLCRQAPVDNTSFLLSSHDLKGDKDNKLFSPRYPALNRSFQTAHFVMHYSAQDSVDAFAVSKVLEDHYNRIVGDFGIKDLAGPVHAEIYPDVESYHFATGDPGAPESDVGMAVDNNRFKIVSPGNPGKYHTYESMLKAALHEFVHCVHYHFIDQLSEEAQAKIKDAGEAPWLFEAIACYEAGQFYHPAKFEYLRKGQYPTLKELNNVEDNGKIYDVGYTLIEFISTTWGRGAVKELLRKNGNLVDALRTTEEEFLAKFSGHIHERIRTAD